MSKIAVITGSIRAGRFAEKPAAWILDLLAKREGVDAVSLDLIDFPLPFFAEPMSPAYAPDSSFGKPEVAAWRDQIAAADGFVIVTPEYNHGYSAVLKNALDYVYKEWSRKPVAFISYGNVGGARAIEQLRQVVIELDMAPIKQAIHVPVEIIRAYIMEGVKDPSFEGLNDTGNSVIDNLLWWTEALKSARNAQ